jgi:uncharacterized protein YkwD
MRYAKLDLATFTGNLSDGRYKDRTGARRAIGKVSEWSAKDKAAAHALVNKRFGESDSPTDLKEGKKVKVAKPAKRVAAKAAPKPVKAAAPKKASRTAAPAAFSRDAVSFTELRPALAIGAPEPVSTSRMVASANVIQTLKNVTPLTPSEKLAYDVAVAEFTVNESDDARAVRTGAQGGSETPSEPKRAAPTKTVPPPKKPHSNGVASSALPAPPSTPAPATTSVRAHVAVPTAPVAVKAPPQSLEELEAAKRNLSMEDKAALDRLNQLGGSPTIPDVGAIPQPIG